MLPHVTKHLLVLTVRIFRYVSLYSKFPHACVPRQASWRWGHAINSCSRTAVQWPMTNSCRSTASLWHQPKHSHPFNWVSLFGKRRLVIWLKIVYLKNNFSIVAAWTTVNSKSWTLRHTRRRQICQMWWRTRRPTGRSKSPRAAHACKHSEKPIHRTHVAQRCAKMLADALSMANHHNHTYAMYTFTFFPPSILCPV